MPVAQINLNVQNLRDLLLKSRNKSSGTFTSQLKPEKNLKKQWCYQTSTTYIIAETNLKFPDPGRNIYRYMKIKNVRS